MNPNESIFSGYGVYEGIGAVGCPTGQMEAFPGAGFCIPTISTPQAACPAGTMEPFPGAGVCVSSTSSTPATLPGVPMIPGPCPAGTIGIPPNCFPAPIIPGPQGTPPAPQTIPVPG